MSKFFPSRILHQRISIKHSLCLLNCLFLFLLTDLFCAVPAVILFLYWHRGKGKISHLMAELMCSDSTAMAVASQIGQNPTHIFAIFVHSGIGWLAIERSHTLQSVQYPWNIQTPICVKSYQNNQIILYPCRPLHIEIVQSDWTAFRFRC